MPLRKLKPVPEPKFQTELPALKKARFRLNAIANQLTNFDEKIHHKDPHHIQVFENDNTKSALAKVVFNLFIKVFL